MLNVGTWRLFLWLHRDDLVQAAYRGVLGRESDPSGLAAYKKNLGQTRDLAEVLTGLARSDEFWDKTIAWRALDFVRAAFRGLLDRKPDPEALDAYGAALSHGLELSDFLADIIRSEEFRSRVIALHAESLVDGVFRGLLGRKPDPEALDAHGTALSHKPEISGLLVDVIHSDEFWDRIITLHAAKLVHSVFQGLLGREPDPEALDAYSASLSKDRELSGFLSVIMHSDEFWNRIIAVRARDLVRAVYRGLLGSDPDPEAEADCCAGFPEAGGLAGMLEKAMSSNEFWDKAVVSRAPEIAGAIYRAIHGIDPDPEKQTLFADPLSDHGTSRGTPPVAMHFNEFAAGSNQQNKPRHPSEKYDVPCFVFIHIQKTAGTSLQNHLGDCFEPSEIYREFSDSLHMFSPAQLSRYNVFAGHFNHDSLAFIPRRKLSVFTFVRDPKKRLISLYHFWRAHEPGHASYDGGIPLANLLFIEEFFESERVPTDFGLWNHMFWAVMGDREWRKWRGRLLNETDTGLIRDAMEKQVRPAVARRLREFIFIGLQEDFERSVGALYRILRLPIPDRIRTDKSLDGLMKCPDFKRTMKRQPMTPRLDAALDRFVQLDNVIYDEARSLYPEWVS